MKQARAFATIAMFAAVALMFVAGLVAVVLAILEVLSPSDLWGVTGAFRTGFYASLCFGVVPALFGVPAYWLLWRAGRAVWPTALLVGALLGGLVAIVERGLTAWGIGCGILVAGLTHIATKRWLGPNYPLQPTTTRQSNWRKLFG